jgi:Shedu protein SduA, C-terminal
MATQRDSQKVAAALEVRIKGGPLPHGCFDIQTVVVKKGPQAYKTATLWTFGNPETAEIKKTELRLQSWNAKTNGPGFDFEERPNTWCCEESEIGALAAFLTGELDVPGVYHRIGADSPLAAVVESVQAGEADATQLQQIAQALADAPNASQTLAKYPVGQVLLDGIQSARQREVIDRLNEAVNNPQAIEDDFQKVLSAGWWIFGGRYIGKAKRRSLAVLDQLDIPLIRADGALHVVELKRANVPNLVTEYRNHHIVGPRVNEAVGQATNYLRSLDEQRHIIKNELGIECRRAFATIVIGDHQYVRDATADQVAEVLRTYNSHLSRIEVITYADLIQGAEGALALSLEGSEGKEDEWPPPF